MVDPRAQPMTTWVDEPGRARYTRMMRIQVRLFAILRDKARVGSFDLVLPADTTVAQAMESIGRIHPALAAYLPRAAPAVNREYARGERILVDGDELALIPPVSGG